MNRRRISTTLVATVIALLGILAGLSFFWGATRAEGVIAIIKTTGMFGLARGQTARINVLNSGEIRGFVIDWKFLDASGRTVAESGGPVSIPLGQAESFDLAFDDFFPTESIRTELRAVVTLSVRHDAVVTGEVFDIGTGKTTSTPVFEDCACGHQ